MFTEVFSLLFSYLSTFQSWYVYIKKCRTWNNWLNHLLKRNISHSRQKKNSTFFDVFSQIRRNFSQFEVFFALNVKFLVFCSAVIYIDSWKIFRNTNIREKIYFSFAQHFFSSIGWLWIVNEVIGCTTVKKLNNLFMVEPSAIGSGEWTKKIIFPEFWAENCFLRISDTFKNIPRWESEISEQKLSQFIKLNCCLFFVSFPFLLQNREVKRLFLRLKWSKLIALFKSVDLYHWTHMSRKLKT